MITWKSISKNKLTLYGMPVLTIIVVLLLWLPVIKYIVDLHRSFFPVVPIMTIESDDWGALRALDWRLPSDRWIKWSQLDCLETPTDVKNISSVLARYRDGRDRPVIITANVVFESIVRVNGRIERKRVPHDVIMAWKDAIATRVFYPQLHAMREADEQSLMDSDASVRKYKSPYMVWKGSRFVDLPAERVDRVVLEGQDLFYRTFSFKSLSTVAPGYNWGRNADIAFAKAGIKYIQGFQMHSDPRRMRPFFPGDRTESKRIILAMRTSFEPAFAWDKGTAVEEFVTKKTNKIISTLATYQPVAISTHRINYVSGHNVSQAEYGRVALDLLLSRLFQQQPSLIVLTSPELGELVEEGSFTDVFSGERVSIPHASLWKIASLSWKYGDYTKRNLLISLALVVVSIYIWVRKFRRI